MIVGAYVLNVYCRNYWSHPIERPKAEYVSEFGSNARAQARHDGWVLLMDKGEAICPKCAKAMKEAAR